jgi:hypothetical protein
VRQRGRQHAAEHTLEELAPGRKRVEPAGDVGAVRIADAGLREQLRQPYAGLGVSPDGIERGAEHAPDLVDAGERRGHAGGAHVVVLDDEMAARGNRVPETLQDGNALGEVEQQKPRVHEVERRARDRRVLRQVVAAEPALAMAQAIQPLDGVGAERVIDVEAEDAAGRTNPLGHQAHRLAGPTARVDAARARCQPDRVEGAPGRGVPRPRLQAQPLVLLGRALERVPVSLRGTHRCLHVKMSIAIAALAMQ